VNGHDRGADQADRVLRHWPYHLLASLAANQFGFALFFGHWKTLRQSLDHPGKGVKARVEAQGERVM
jgi:hypothetical protein